MKRYEYDAILLRTRYQPSISDICIGKSEMKMPFSYRFDIDNAICQADIEADMETTKYDGIRLSKQRHSMLDRYVISTPVNRYKYAILI